VLVKGSCKALQPARVIDDRVQLHAGKQACHVHAQLEQGLQQSGELAHAPCQLREVRAEQSQDAHWIESSLVSKNSILDSTSKRLEHRDRANREMIYVESRAAAQVQEWAAVVCCHRKLFAGHALFDMNEWGRWAEGAHWFCLEGRGTGGGGGSIMVLLQVSAASLCCKCLRYTRGVSNLPLRASILTMPSAVRNSWPAHRSLAVIDAMSS